MASSLGRWRRRTRASRCSALRPGNESAPMAAPRYKSAAVVNGPTPAPRRWMKGVVTPNANAASAASMVPRTIGLPAMLDLPRPLEDREPHPVEGSLVLDREADLRGELPPA